MDKIKSILRKINGEITFSKDDDYVMSGILDSVDVVQVTAELEKQFKVSVPGALITPENFRNFYTIVELVQQLGGSVQE